MLTFGVGLCATLQKFSKFLHVPTSPSSILNLKAADSFETSANFYQITRRHHRKYVLQSLPWEAVAEDANFICYIVSLTRISLRIRG
jgi:hypothetical protein